MQALNVSQTRASRNQGILYDAGFLKLRKEGLWSLYSVDSDGMPEYFPYLLEAAKKALKDNRLVVQDSERLMKAERVGPGRVRRLRH